MLLPLIFVYIMHFHFYHLDILLDLIRFKSYNIEGYEYSDFQIMGNLRQEPIIYSWNMLTINAFFWEGHVSQGQTEITI